LIDVQNENTLPLGEARDLPWLKGRRGNRISKDALRRWSLRGLRGVVLETVRIGGTTFTSTEAVLRFLVRLNEGHAVASDRVRGNDIARADKELDKAGI
jgi:hypothetical protein